MAFHESPRFPDDIAYGASGGPEWSTDVVVLDSGHEGRNQNWSVPRAVYEVAHAVKTQAQLNTLIAFFLATAKGRANGFRFKDWSDYQVATADGRLGAGAAGTGLPAYQVIKRYSSGSESYDRIIKKPVGSSVTVYRSGSPVTFGIGAGQVALDATTGTITFVADASAMATSITPGATTQIVLAGNPGALAAGQLLHLSSFSGTDAAIINDLAHTVNTVVGTGPYTFTLATNTSGKTITLGSGQGKKYPQASESLTWAGEFDVPARFDTDRLAASAETYNLWTWGQIPIVEIRI